MDVTIREGPTSMCLTFMLVAGSFPPPSEEALSPLRLCYCWSSYCLLPRLWLWLSAPLFVLGEGGRLVVLWWDGGGRTCNAGVRS
jgi:hypothetical protein